MEQYCISDVKLLKAGCQKFQSEFASHADFRPMEKCATIASACNRFWRKKLLPLQTITIEPPRGWHGAMSNQSFKAFKWLAWQESKLRKAPQSSTCAPQADRIQHAGNGGEVRVLTPGQSFLVDGYNTTTKTVYEFHGCLFHGCPLCFPRRDQYSKLNRDRTFQEMYKATVCKHTMLEHAGYKLIHIWECQWDKQVNRDSDLCSFVASLSLPTPLEPHDAFFGCRTNAAALYYKTDTSIGEEIKYVDVTSLYPFINTTGDYPVGHPEIITRPDTSDITRFFGVAKVDVIPPYGLYHPVLPFRYGKTNAAKLTFPLCRSYVESEMSRSSRQELCL